jgi:hypothetical protein
MIRRLAPTLAALAALALAIPVLHAQAPSATQAGQVNVPDNASGRALKAWLESFNSGDAAKMDAYYKKYEPEKSADDQMPFRTQTGGFELLSVEKSEPLHVEFLVKERNGDRRAYGIVDVAPGAQGGVKNFMLSVVPNGAKPADFTIDADTRARVIEGAIAKLNESYVFPEAAKGMADAVRARQKRGEYDAVTNGMTFASLLTQHLREVSHDKHLRVNFSAAKIPDRPEGPPSPEAVANYKKQMERVNCGFVKVEQLPGNVGYLKFNMFADPDVCGPTATAAMTFLGGVDALIVDLRDNGGGDPAMVALISSYLFDEPTHLNDLWTRTTNETAQYWTLPYVPGKRLGKEKPVYVLTAKRTFSGAEEFSNNLKALKRATIVGETTGGGAHPVSGHRIDDHFSIGVPFARAINPITKTNWEGTGVEPDVKVPAADALTTAQKLIAEKAAMKGPALVP